jgi:hypothetical protein
MSKNTCAGKRRIEARLLLSTHCGRRAVGVMRTFAAMSLSLAGILAMATFVAARPPAAAQATDTKIQRRAGPHQLSAELPARIRKGEPASLILRVEQKSQPDRGVAACLAPVPLFPSEEDAADTTPALGTDLGVGAESESQPGCVMGIAGVRTAPDTYQFTWEPDTAGRANLRFTLGDSQLNVPVDVGSAPPNPAILAGFGLFVALTLIGAARMHRMRQAPHGNGGPR